MSVRPMRRSLLCVTAIVSLSLAGPALGQDDPVELSFLIDNSPDTIASAERLVADFEEKNPDIDIEIETRPGGGEGDNIIKTRLATGEMTDVFNYNSGSLFQAINPTETLIPLTDQPFMEDVIESFKTVVTAGEGDVYGVPFETAMGGGILYNRRVYEELRLEVPKTWDEFMANNEAAMQAGITPVIQTYRTTWTSQLFVLADYYNVAEEVPEFAAAYTANEAHYADTPAALRSFERLQDAYDSGWWNEDYGSATYEDALQMLIDGDIAQYPMLTFALSEINALDAEAAQSIGFFAQPGEDAESNGMTLWMPAGAYIAATTEHEDVAKAFLAFIASVEGTEVQTAAAAPGGPYMIEGATLPDDVLPAVQDVQSYIDAGNFGPALEFLSPLKGPNLEQITVEVGSGLRSAEDAAALYDEDVEKQAQQLGLPGW